MLQRKLLWRPVIIVLIAIIAFSSCTTGKRYQQPALDLPKSFEAAAPADTVSIADLEWKFFFSDTALQSLIENGIRYNHDLQLAINRLDISGSQLKQARALSLPEANLAVSGQYNRPSKNSLSGLSANSFLGKNHIDNFLTIVNLSWELDIWGKISRQKEAALAQYLQSGEAVKVVQTQLVADIAQGYFNLQKLGRQLDIAKRNLVLSDTFLIDTRLLKEAGIGNSLAVQQAEAQKLSTQLLIPGLEQQITIQENALRFLTGQLPGKLAIGISQEDVSKDSLLAPGLPVSLISRRPDVRSSELALVQANARVGIAQANRYPALNITAGGGLESFKASNWFNIPNSLFGLAAGTITQPIFRRRALKTQFEVATLEREQAVISFRRSALVAVEEVANALSAFSKLNEQRIIANAQVYALDTAVLQAQQLFKSDMATYLEVITAQGNALNAELNLAEIERSQSAARIELYRALGGGWK
ncbi:MAG: efflux transporter outer membrane subunit [Flavitalea sp.]